MIPCRHSGFSYSTSDQLKPEKVDLQVALDKQSGTYGL